MTDNLDANNTGTASAGTGNTEHMIPKSRFDDVNNKYKEAMERIAALEQASQEQASQAETQRQQELAEQNRYKELYEQTLSQLEALKGVQKELTRYKDGFQANLQTRLEAIPEERRHIVPEFDDPIKLSAWLDKAIPDLTAPLKPTAPRLDAGAGNSVGQRNTSSLTAEEIAMATAAGIPLDAYAAAKAQRGQPIDLNTNRSNE